MMLVKRPSKKAGMREKIVTTISDHPDWNGHLDFFLVKVFKKSRGKASQRLEEIFKENFHLSN